jgi:chromosome segregation and condensation protein ScpB
MPEDLKYIIESLLFVSETPLTMDRLKGIRLRAKKPLRSALPSMNLMALNTSSGMAASC